MKGQPPLPDTSRSRIAFLQSLLRTIQICTSKRSNYRANSSSIAVPLIDTLYHEERLRIRFGTLAARVLFAREFEQDRGRGDLIAIAS